MNHGESCQTVQREHARTHFYTGSRHGRSHSEGLGGRRGCEGWGGGHKCMTNTTQSWRESKTESRNVSGGGANQWRKCEGSVKRNEREKGGCYN